MNIAYLATTNDPEFKDISAQIDNCIVIQSLSDLPNEHHVDAFIVSAWNSSYAIDQLTNIKSNNHFFLTPLFLSKKTDINEDLADGYFTTINQMSNKVKEIQKRIQQIKHSHFYNGQERLLTYLFTRPEVTLKPRIGWYKKQLYHYPLIELFEQNDLSTHYHWLNELNEQDLLEKVKLVDQFFVCPDCHSVHLKFSEHCASCNSINITSKTFLHCFSCGFVAPQDDFETADGFVCPRCNTALRHIGEDYDRPLESGVCQDCGEHYIDPTVLANCLTCHKTCATDHLVTRKIYEYSLTDYACYEITSHDGVVLSTGCLNNRYISFKVFCMQLDWMLNILKTTKNKLISLIVITKFSENDLDELLAFLRKDLRLTDLITKDSDGFICMLLPDLTTDDTNNLKESILNAFKDKNLSVKNQTYDKEKATAYSSAKELMARLKKS